ncbi:hypothetical protein KFK09_006871 [Dendrobium nobile]|uniref:pyruvate kinase n=1 Tax=Dendrobium nobile TaxID=94219 RepID=A0A8T3BVL3_DENNO|nr:hypothetical protein KFK09_006871 [Dendrobium nobile]
MRYHELKRHRDGGLFTTISRRSHLSASWPGVYLNGFPSYSSSWSCGSSSLHDAPSLTAVFMSGWTLQQLCHAVMEFPVQPNSVVTGIVQVIWSISRYMFNFFNMTKDAVYQAIVILELSNSFLFRPEMNSLHHVENQEGVVNFDDILKNTDAFMAARGDIAKATDVAIADLDGSDCVMLSGETVAGAYPELAIQTMAKICLEKASLILVLTRGGSTMKLVAKYLPAMPILLVVVPELKATFFIGPAVMIPLLGIIPMQSTATAKASTSEATDEAVGLALDYAKSIGLCSPGDSVVALHRLGATSIIKLLPVK